MPNITPLVSVPAGLKENIYFIVDNTNNCDRKAQGLKCHYPDDCGAWLSSKGTSPKALYAEYEGVFKSIVKHDGLYCLYRKPKTYTALNPQPADSEVTVLQRNYATLKADTNYRRRVSWLINSKQKLAVVEYVGKFPGRHAHGNIKVQDDAPDYIRTNPATLEKISELAKHKNPSAVYQQMILESSLTSGPRNSQQVRNKKYTDKRAERGEVHYSNNYSDHVQHILSEVNRDPFVQQVIISKDTLPAIILGDENVIRQTINMCCEAADPSVLGVDKTYNLGHGMFVTVTSYKHKGVMRRSTKDHPIVMGPVMIHGNGTTNVYMKFFNWLKEKTVRKYSNIVIGSDSEGAIRQGIKLGFPEAVNILCIRHLKQNLNDYLVNKVGCNKGERRCFENLIFGDYGITNAHDEFTWKERIQKVRDAAGKMQNTKLDSYLDKRFIPTIREGVYEPHIKLGWATSQWTNNNSESANHQLKTATEWKVLNLRDLVKRLVQVLSAQQRDLERAIVDMGNFQLSNSHKTHKVNPNVSRNLSKEEQDKRIICFQKHQKATSGKLITSTDGMLTVPHSPSGGKKPHQRTRKRPNRTTPYKPV